MQIPAHFDLVQREALEQLRKTDRRFLKSLFCECKPPNMETFIGEFDAELLDQGGRAAQFLTGLVFGSSGDWIGKAFRPVNSKTGVGYNCFRDNDRVEVKLPMDTRIATSSMAPGESLIISYRDRNRGLIRWLVGEVREVVPGVMLGIGVFGPRLGKRDRVRRKMPFVMVGPVRDYQFDSPAAPIVVRKTAA